MTTAAGPLPAAVINAVRVRDRGRLRRACERAAAAAGWQPPLLLTMSADDDGAVLAKAAVSQGASMVLAVGGDGTVRACAEGLAGSGVPLAIIPAGTGNLTARALHVPVRLEHALKVAFAGRTRTVDLGEVDGWVFVAMAGIGLDAAVVDAAHTVAKQVAGWPAYAFAACTQLLRRPVSFTIRLDGGEPLTRRARCVTVGNSGALPGGFHIMPDAEPDDGLLDVVVLAPAGLLGWAGVGSRVATGSDHDDSALERYQAAEVEIVAASRQPRQIDGEVIPPAVSQSARVLPGALLVRVPAGDGGH